MTLLYSLRKVLYIANVNGDLICLRFGHHPKRKYFIHLISQFILAITKCLLNVMVLSRKSSDVLFFIYHKVFVYHNTH